MDTTIDEPVCIAAQFRLVDSAVSGVRDQIRSKNTLKTGLSHDWGTFEAGALTVWIPERSAPPRIFAAKGSTGQA